MEKTSIGHVSLNVVEQGQGRPLLLVHGFPLDHTMWQGQLDGLAREFQVIAPDLRGFGRSDVTPDAVSMQQFADDLAALLDARHITQPVALCGLSMGGYIAWQFWQRHAHRLSHLILCDTRAVADTAEAAHARRENAQSVVRYGASALAVTMIPKLFAEKTLNERPAIVEATRQVMLNNAPLGIAAALQGMADRTDMTSALPQIQVPALVICGQHDVISPPDEMRGIAQTLPDGSYVEIAEAGHMSPLEQPAPVNQAILAFLRG